MVQAKLEIVATGGDGGGMTHSDEILENIMAEYIQVPPQQQQAPQQRLIVESKYLFGGYSGSNYRVTLQDGSTYVLKITNGYSADNAERMCRTAYHLCHTCGFSQCISPLTKQPQQQQTAPENSSPTFQFVSLREPQGIPAFVLNFVHGQQADQVLRNHPSLATIVMREIGSGLAQMHKATTTCTENTSMLDQATQAEKLGLRWYQTSGGCCLLHDHVTGKMLLEKILDTDATCPSNPTRRKTFESFYRPELQALQNVMNRATVEGNIPMGIIHGDPFADNIMVDPTTGSLVAFIDIEDICVGPLLFDLACCAIGCCFRVHSNHGTVEWKQGGTQVLDLDWLAALLQGYLADRDLSLLERDLLVPFMRMVLLCNCTWRFLKFNGTIPFPDEAQLSYVELQDRIAHLHDERVVEQIQSLLI